MPVSYTNAFVITTIGDDEQEVNIREFSDDHNNLSVSYRGLTRRVNVEYERSADEEDRKNLKNVIIKLTDQADSEIATISPKFNVHEDLSWSGTNGASVVGYVTSYPPDLTLEGEPADTSFRLTSADECIVLRVEGGAESIDSITLDSFSVGYESPYIDPSVKTHRVVKEILNKGPNDAEGVDADLVIGENLNVMSVEVSKGTYAESEWVVGDMLLDESVGMVIECNNTSEYEDTIEFVVGSDSEDPDESTNTQETVVPGIYTAPVSIQKNGFVFNGYTKPKDIVRMGSSGWSVQDMCPHGVCLLRREFFGNNPSLAFSSYRNGVGGLSGTFRPPQTITMIDDETGTEVEIPLVERIDGSLSSNGTHASTVVTARYHAVVTITIDPPEEEPEDPEDPEDPVDPEDPDVENLEDPEDPVDPEDPEEPEDPPEPIVIEKTFESVEVFHFMYDMSDAGSDPVMTKINTVPWNNMSRKSDVLQNPEYILFSGSRIVHVPTGSTVVQGTNGMDVLMVEDDGFSRILLSMEDGIRHVRVNGDEVLGTEEISYGGAFDMNVIDAPNGTRVFTFSYLVSFGGEVITQYKTYALTDDPEFVEEIEVGNMVPFTLPYAKVLTASKRENGELRGFLLGVDEDATPNQVSVHRMIEGAEGELLFDDRVLYRDFFDQDNKFLTFDESELKDFIETP